MKKTREPHWINAELFKQLDAVAPGMIVGFCYEKSRIDFKDGATEKQRQDAAAVMSSFDYSAEIERPLTTDERVKTLESQVAELQKQLDELKKKVK